MMKKKIDLWQWVIKRFAFCLAVILVGFFLIISDRFTVEIDPEYLNGLLSGASILFGFWAILLQRKEHSNWQVALRRYIIQWFLFSTFLLAIAVIGVFLCAIGALPSFVTLSLLLSSFTLNAFFVSASFVAQERS
jgi:hypothetical protein